MKGRVKQATGVLLDDEKLESEGKIDRLAGDLKDRAEQVVDTIKEAVGGEDD